MRLQKILWTVLPNGVQNGQLRFSVLASPRLTPLAPSGAANPPAQLSQFPDFLDWPRAVANLRFTLTTDSGFVARGLTPLTTSGLSPAFWQALFPASLEVRPFVFQDYSDRPVRNYPATDVEKMITQRYRRLAIDPDPTRPPGIDAMRDMFGSMMMTSDQRAQMHTLVNGALAQQKVVPPSPPDDLDLPEGMGPDQWMLVAADGFHRPDADPRRPALAPPKIEFHDLISALSQYPALMRRLGLIFDVALPAPADWGLVLTVTPEWTSALPATERSDVSLNTHLDDIDRRTFLPYYTEDDEFRFRMLRLNDQGLYQTTQIEVGSTALRVTEYAAYLSEENEPYVAPPPPDRPDGEQGERQVGAPSLRSEGIAVNRNNLAPRLRTSFGLSRDNNQYLADGEFFVLYGADLIRGYRIDVREVDEQDCPGEWHSLCRRGGTYQFVRTGQRWDAPEEEGWISLAASEPTAPPVPGETRIHETIFRWEGWSLSVARPGSAIMPDGALGSDDTPAPGQDLLRVDFAVPPGSLPKLRFGRRYQLRARVVDLAGNSLAYSVADDVGATPPIRYTRLQPVASPHVALRQSLETSPGESVDRVVIRSFLNADGTLPGAVQPSERHIVPPRTSPRMAEWHGQFDTAQGAVNPASYDIIAAKQGDLREVHQEEQIALPYLPDPIVRGATLAGLPGGEWEPTQISFWPTGVAWPEGRPFRIRLGQGDGPPQWDEAKRVLSVFLPPAEIASVDLSAYLNDADLKLMGVWGWVEDRDPDNKEELRRRALQGCHWMMTPCRRLTLVHAVQRPLIAPAFQHLQGTRGPGDTAVHLFDDAAMPIDGKSTLRVDIEARWQDPVDLPEEPGWREIPSQAHAATLTISADQAGIPLSGQIRHELGDTKRRRVSYQAVATTRFREYFSFNEQEIQSQASPIIRRSAPVEVDVPSSAPPLAPEVLYVVPTFTWRQVRKGGELVRERRGNGLRVFLKRGWFSSGEGELLGVVFQQEGVADLPPFVRVPVRAMGPYVTQWGIDPIWGVGPATGPSWNELRSAFPAARYVGENLDLREAANNPALQAVSVAGHEVHLDKERDLLYCDIDIDARTYYMPFVRLALARVQPNSVSGMHLSPIVRTDFAQLTPDRVASVTVASHGGSAAVTVTGIGQAADIDNLLQFGRIEVQLETRIDGMPEDDLAWRPFTEFQEVPIGLGPELEGGVIRWTETVPLPDPQHRPTDLRLAIREYEMLDPSATWDDEQTRPVSRLVYADALPLFGSGTR